MIIHIKVKPKSGMRKVESFGDNRYLVYLKEPPENNRANIELLNVLSKFLGTPVTRIKIKKGFSSDKKTLEIT